VLQTFISPSPRKASPSPSFSCLFSSVCFLVEYGCRSLTHQISPPRFGCFLMRSADTSLTLKVTHSPSRYFPHLPPDKEIQVHFSAIVVYKFKHTSRGMLSPTSSQEQDGPSPSEAQKSRLLRLVFHLLIGYFGPGPKFRVT